MFERKVAVWVARPREEVFPYVADARNRPEWDEDVISEELISPEPIGVGSTIRTRMRAMGREQRYEWRITEHEAPARVGVESTSGPFPTTLRFDLAEDRDGTQLEFTITGRPSGALRLLEPLIARRVGAGLERNFANLKDVLEQRPVGSSSA
jgi:hypothetical protein